MLQEEFIFDHAPFKFCHASSIIEVPGALLVVFFAGSREGGTDVGIWLSKKMNNKWSKPLEIADGVINDNERYACWNPVLYKTKNNKLILFYKIGQNCSDWFSMYKYSENGGETWSKPKKLPDGIWGPILNKIILMPDGTTIAPSSVERGGWGEGWQIHLEYSDEGFSTWRKSEPLNNTEKFSAIQPAIVTYPSGRMQILCRTRQGCIACCWSDDNGNNWSPMEATSLPNPDSGIDAVTLKDGKVLLIYNHNGIIEEKKRRFRTPLNAAVTSDGITWIPLLTLEDSPEGAFSYPSVIQTEDALAHVTYTWNSCKIKHVVFSI